MKSNGMNHIELGGTWGKTTSKAMLCLFLSLILTLGLLLGIMAEAKADDDAIIYIAGNGTKISEDKSGTGWSYAASTKTLTLNNLNIDYGDGSGINAGIKYEGSEALTINLQGNNIINWGYDAYGIYVPNASITFTGNGSLNCTGGTKAKSYGIYVKNLTIQSGTMTFNGGEATDTNGGSYGVYTTGNLTIQGGTVNGTGGKSSYTSCGINVANTLTITNGTVTAKGGQANNTSIGVSGIVDVSGGKMTATGGKGTNGSYGIHSGNNNIIVSGGTVEAKGGTADTNSIGICLNSSRLTIENGVTALTATGNNCGIVGTVINAVAGKGWTDTGGTAGETVIAASTADQNLAAYKKVQIPFSYDLWVGGTQVTDNQHSGTGWKFDSSNNTLTLENYTYTGEGYDPGGTSHKSAIYNKISGLKILLVGSSSITNTGDGGGVYSTQTITISGNGSLNMKGRVGITAWNDLIVDGGTIKIDAKDFGLYCTGHIHINDGKIEATAKGDVSNPEGICASGSVYICGGSVTSKGDGRGIYAENQISISGGTVSAEGSGEYGIGLYAARKINITGGVTTATGNSKAMWPSPNNTMAGLGWTDTAGTAGKAEIAANASGEDLDSYKKVQFPAEIKLGGRTQWLFGDTIDFNSASLTYETFYNYVRYRPSSTLQINNGSYTVTYENWNTETQYFNLPFKHSNGAYYLQIRPEDYEAATPKMPIGIKLVSGEGTNASPYLFDLMYDETSAATYTVTVTNDGHGTGSASPASGATGTEVTLTASSSNGYKFKEWQVVSGGVTVTDNKFTIGTEHVEVMATFEQTATEGPTNTPTPTTKPTDAPTATMTVPPTGTPIATASPTPAPIRYNVYSGAGQSYQQGSGKDGVFTVKRSTDDEKTFSLFSNIQVDGVTVNKRNYEVSKGSVIIIMKSAYLDTLSVGAHTLKVLFTDGSVEIPFTVSKSGGDRTKYDDVAVPSSSFTFKKVWEGGSEQSIDFTLYKQGGEVYHHAFNKTAVSDTKWEYNAWFSSPVACYVIEDPVPGYRTRYENVGVYAKVTDRCCDGGTIVNYKVPKTGDEANLPLWIGCAAAGLALLFAAVYAGKRKKGNQ